MSETKITKKAKAAPAPAPADNKRIRGSKSSVKRDSVTKRQIDIPNDAYNNIKMVNLLRTSDQQPGTTLHDLLVESIEIGAKIMRARAEGKPAPYVAALIKAHLDEKK